MTTTDVLKRLCEHSCMVNFQCVAIRKDSALQMNGPMDFDGNTVIDCTSIADMSFRYDDDKLMVYMKFGRWKNYVDMAAAFEKVSRLRPMDDTALVNVLTIVQDEDVAEDITYLSGFTGMIHYDDADCGIETYFPHGSWDAFKILDKPEEDE